MSKYTRDIKKYDKQIAAVKRLEKSIVDSTYHSFTKSYMDDLKEVIDNYGLPFEISEFQQILHCYNTNTLSVSNVQLLNSLNKKYKRHIPYMKSFIDRLMECLEGENDE